MLLSLLNVPVNQFRKAQQASAPNQILKNHQILAAPQQQNASFGSSTSLSKNLTGYNADVFTSSASQPQQTLQRHQIL
jgi:hypothetical protein